MDGAEILARLAGEPTHVVIVRALRLGDLLCATPALRSLRAALPHARLTLIGLPLAAEFVPRCAALDRFEEFPGYPGVADQAVDPRRTVAFLRHMQEQNVDLAVQLHGSGVFSNPFTRLLGARHMVGFTREGETDLGLDFAIPYPEQGREVHRLLALTRALGAPETGDRTELTVLERDRAEIAAHGALRELFETAKGPVVGLHPGAKIATRRWMPDRFAAVGDRLAERYGAAVVITGGTDERETCRRVRTLMRHPALDLSGQTSLGGLAALLERLDLFVTNDSGPAHLAAAVGTRSVTIFGAARVEDWAAPDTTRHRALSVAMPCRPCYYTECPIGYRCLRGVTVESVLHEAADLFDHAPASSFSRWPALSHVGLPALSRVEW